MRGSADERCVAFGRKEGRDSRDDAVSTGSTPQMG